MPVLGPLQLPSLRPKACRDLLPGSRPPPPGLPSSGTRSVLPSLPPPTSHLSPATLLCHLACYVDVGLVRGCNPACRDNDTVVLKDDLWNE